MHYLTLPPHSLLQPQKDWHDEPISLDRKRELGSHFVFPLVEEALVIMSLFPFWKYKSSVRVSRVCVKCMHSFFAEKSVIEKNCVCVI